MVKIRKLSCGVRVVMQQMAHVRSVSLGVWVNTGSVRESAAESGASHFIEHILFKGTERRSAEDIAREMDAVGGNLNAFTSKECTCFYAKVLDENMPVAVDILSDLVLHSALDEAEIKKEQGVVVEEILMTEDSPEDVCAERANALFFEGEPLARPILGTQETVNSFSAASLRAYMSRHYVPGNLVIACAGHFDEDALLALLEAAFDMPENASAAEKLSERYPGGRRIACIKKDIEQVHISFMFPGFAREHAGQFPLAVLSNAIGGSMSSRLFQSIREKRGLAYTVYSYPSAYTSTGSFALYAGTGEKQAAEVTRVMLEELESLRAHGLTEEEFLRCKQQLKGSYLLGMESTGALMNALGKDALLQNREYSEKETLRRIECVTMQDINEILPVVLDPNALCAAFVGRVEKHEKEFRALTEID